MEFNELMDDSKSQEQKTPVKKVKVVISDLHLGKGKFLPSGELNLLEEFYFGDKLVEFLHYYHNGVYRDYDVELIINGDFLNFLQVDYRNHFLTVITESVAVEILQSILDGHPKVFKEMASFAAKSGNQITYVIGNHDQPMMWPACRELFNNAVNNTVRYKNLVYFFDGVHIEHGHMHEAANRMNPKKFFLKKDLPEPILNLPFGSQFFIEFVLKLKDKLPHIDKIRPFSKMIKWTVLNEPGSILGSVFSLAWYLISNLLSKNPRKVITFKKLAQIILESAVFPDLSESARKVLNDERVHTVIFGHSHVYQYRQWASGKEYFNTGTWTDVTSLDIVSLGKITKLTYVFIEYPEDGSRPHGRLKEWRGYHRIEEDVAVS